MAKNKMNKITFTINWEKKYIINDLNEKKNVIEIVTKSKCKDCVQDISLKKKAKKLQ